MDQQIRNHAEKTGQKMMFNQPDVKLRPTETSDLHTLFQFQLDREGGYMAAFMPGDFSDPEAYFSKHTRLINDPTVNYQTILMDQIIVGSIAKFILNGQAEITYWIERKYWAQGIATKALNIFMSIEPARPIKGAAAFDNIGSQRVMEKCGFKKTGSGNAFANARQEMVEEYIYKLD